MKWRETQPSLWDELGAANSAIQVRLIDDLCSRELAIEVIHWLLQFLTCFHRV